MDWYVEERESERGGGRRRTNERRGWRGEMANTKEKTPAQLVWTESRSHDLNIVGDESCPRRRDSFLRQTCTVSGLSDGRQWSIVAVDNIHHWCKEASIWTDINVDRLGLNPVRSASLFGLTQILHELNNATTAKFRPSVLRLFSCYCTFSLAKPLPSWTFFVLTL